MSIVEVTWNPTPDPRRQGEAMLAAAVARFCGVLVEEVRLSHLCRHCGSNRHGRPVVLQGDGVPRPPEVSLSRGDEGVLVAVGDAGPVGVDVERLDEPGWEQADRVLLHPGERPADGHARAVTWVRKESLLKATGHGLRRAPHTIRLTDASDPPRLLDWQGPEAPAATWMYDVPLDPPHVACLTSLSRHAPRIEVREAPAATAR